MTKCGLPKGVKHEDIIESYVKNGGHITRVAEELGIARSTVREHARQDNLHVKPLVGGNTEGLQATKRDLPAKGKIKRYILTSAQNNTHVHEAVWTNLLALAESLDAEIIVGTYSYNKHAYGHLDVKRHTYEFQSDMWYDTKVVPYIIDTRLELANGLQWCGEMNILPTAKNPLEGLETYSARKSAIFPHAKMQLRSIAGPVGESAKLNYTTGTVTQRNYIQKRAGLLAEFHHIYGALIVEVNSDGHWWVRQLNAVENTGEIQDLDVIARDGEVTTGNPVEAITWGDLHATRIDEQVLEASAGRGGMLDTLKPKTQFIHDLMEGASVNHHSAKQPLERFRTKVRGLDCVATELKKSSAVLKLYLRPTVQTVVVNANHDRWIDKFLDNYDPKIGSPENAILYHDGSKNRLEQLIAGVDDPNVLEYLMKTYTEGVESVKFLGIDDGFTICGKVECGWHGDLGPNGARGGVRNLANVARLANIGHMHSASIMNGLYVAGTSTNLKMFYNHGPSSWSHSHIVTYPNGKRTIITMYDGKWRA